MLQLSRGPLSWFLLLGFAALSVLTLVRSSRAVAADFAISFDSPTPDAYSWLKSRGFEFKIDAGNTRKSRLTITDRGLTIETLRRAEPLVVRPNLLVAQPAKLAIAWGVDRYPPGANWDVGVNNEAIMVIVQFWKDRLPGGLFLPPSPYFIGFFLCEKGRRNVAIRGRSYGRQGRYVCVEGPATGREITTTLDLDAQFRAAFDATSTPPVTGIGIEADTTQVSSVGRSSAWIKSISVTGR